MDLQSGASCWLVRNGRGNGIALSVPAARIIRDLVSGTPNADAEVLRFYR